MRLLLVDDHVLFRRGLELLLSELQPDLQLAHCGSRQALEIALKTPETSGLDLIFLDLNLPGFYGLQALECVRQRLPQTPVVVFSGEEQPGIAQTCVDAGAVGFVAKSAPAASQADALAHWLAVFNTSSSQSQKREFDPASAIDCKLTSNKVDSGIHLTERQREVLRLIVQGKTNKVIGRELGISDGTVKTHLAHLMALLSVNTRTQLVFEMARQGLRVEAPP